MNEYLPRSIQETIGLEIPVDVDRVVEVLAARVHDEWAAIRISEGWRLGKEHDAKRKTHPSLVPYPSLPPEEREVDRRTVRATILALLEQGFEIRRDSSETLRSSSDGPDDPRDPEDKSRPH